MQQANRWRLLQMYITEEAAEGILVCLAGGTHHAFADRGEGFCVFNDIAVSARMAMAEEGVERVLVIDLDVHQVWHKEYTAAHMTFVRGQPSPAHESRSTTQQLTGSFPALVQGNGTSAMFAGDERVTTFDVHGAFSMSSCPIAVIHGSPVLITRSLNREHAWSPGDKNYPWKTRSTSTYDVALPDATGDEEYLALLREWLPRLFAQHQPQLVFFQAGVDAMERDSFGRCLS